LSCGREAEELRLRDLRGDGALEVAVGAVMRDHAVHLSDELVDQRTDALILQPPRNLRGDGAHAQPMRVRNSATLRIIVEALDDAHRKLSVAANAFVDSPALLRRELAQMVGHRHRRVMHVRQRAPNSRLNFWMKLRLARQVTEGGNRVERRE